MHAQTLYDTSWNNHLVHDVTNPKAIERRRIAYQPPWRALPWIVCIAGVLHTLQWLVESPTGLSR